MQMVPRRKRLFLNRWGMASILASLVGGLLACGASEQPAGSAPKIVGGIAVAAPDPIERSTVALLQPSGWQFCTGSLVSQRHVVTAAHCLIDYQDTALDVAFGQTVLPTPKQSPLLRAAVSYATNLHFNPESLSTIQPDAPPNDIALITLAEDAPAGFHPVAAATSKDSLHVGEVLTLAGFGLTAAAAGTSGTLRKVDTKLVATYPHAKEWAFGQTPGKSACMGDSGGPAFVHRAGHLLLVGVTSRGSPDCSDGGIYTDLRFFQTWLKAAAKAMTAEPLASPSGQAKLVPYRIESATE